MQEVNLIGVLSTSGRLPVIEPKTITENGTYNSPSGVDGFNPVVVNVPSQEPNIQERVFASNGTFNPPEGVDGYAPVIIDVPIKEEITLNATMNGTYTPSEGRVYNNVIVNVPLPSNAYLLKSVNTPTPIVSFSDGQEMVMSSLKVAIEPQQEGSGDPSPTNVRPISGWNKVDVTRCGKNLFSYDLPIRDGYWASATSFQGSNNIVTKDNAIGWQYIRLYVEGLSQITLSGFDVQGGTLCAWLGSEDISDIISTFNSAEKNGTKTVPQGAKYICLVIYSIKTKSESYPNAQLELGTTATTYEPYTGTTYTIDLGGTRYGGEVDVINGIVTPAPYYASYNGETLTGEWISDRDKYEVGATPTIGAQVVNIGASGTPVSILPTAVKSLLGQNNIWADTGNITDAEYFSKEA